jgi:hypothetical protein
MYGPYYLDIPLSRAQEVNGISGTDKLINYLSKTDRKQIEIQMFSMPMTM